MIYTKKKTKIILIIIAIIIIGSVAWWFIPTYFLKGVDYKEIATIEVFNGNDGNKFNITNTDDIAYISENIKSVPMKKDSIALGMGTTYNLRFLNSNGQEIDKFIIMNSSTIKNGIIFYKCDDKLQQVENYLIEHEKAQFPETEWVKNQN